MDGALIKEMGNALSSLKNVLKESATSQTLSKEQGLQNLRDTLTAQLSKVDPNSYEYSLATTLIDIWAHGYAELRDAGYSDADARQYIQKKEETLHEKLLYASGTSFFALPITPPPPPVAGSTSSAELANQMYAAIKNSLDDLLWFAGGDTALEAALLYETVRKAWNQDSPEVELPPLEPPSILPPPPGYEDHSGAAHNPGGFTDEGGSESPLPGYGDDWSDGSSFTPPPYTGEEQNPGDSIFNTVKVEPKSTIVGKDGGRFGAKAPIIIEGSKPIKEWENYHLDVETFSDRPCSIHLQPKRGKEKFFYEPQTNYFYSREGGMFMPVPKSMNKKFLNMPGMKDALQKAIEAVGEL